MKLTIPLIIAELRKKPIIITNEKYVQSQIFSMLSEKYWLFNSIRREFYLDDANIIDFLIEEIGVEVKINGSPKSIFYQCERYCSFTKIKEFLLVTNKVMSLPPTIHGKPCFVYNLSQAWL